MPVADLSSSDGSSRLLPLLLAIGLGASLLLVGLAATPLWMLPRRMVGPVYEHREAVLFGGIATAVGIALGLLIALAS